MKRVMTLVGGIIGTVVDAIYSFVALLEGALLLELLGAAGVPGASIFAIVGLLIIAIVVTALVLNAISISGFTCSAEKFAKKRGVIITAVVFNFLLAFLLILSTMTGGVTFFTALVILTSIATGVLFIVDLCLEKSVLQN